jgi:hypothetical protein
MIQEKRLKHTIHVLAKWQCRDRFLLSVQMSLCETINRIVVAVKIMIASTTDTEQSVKWISAVLRSMTRRITANSGFRVWVRSYLRQNPTHMEVACALNQLLPLYASPGWLASPTDQWQSGYRHCKTAGRKENLKWINFLTQDSIEPPWWERDTTLIQKPARYMPIVWKKNNYIT